MLSGADVGEVITAAPQIKVTGDPAEDRAASLIWFTHSVDFDKWTDPEVAYDPFELATGNAVTLMGGYDNCAQVQEIWFVCLLDDWNPENGKTYGPSDESPVEYSIEGEVGPDEMAVYAAWDVNADEREYYLEEFRLTDDPASRFSLTEIPEDDVASEEYFAQVEGWIFFEGSHEDVASGGSEKLPKTGSSMTVVLTSALGAIAVGAVVFFVLRRRKTAENWG